MTIEEAIAKLIQRREIIVITGNAQIQEINNTLAMLGYKEPQSIPQPMPENGKIEKEKVKA